MAVEIEVSFRGTLPLKQKLEDLFSPQTNLKRQVAITAAQRRSSSLLLQLQPAPVFLL